MPKSYDSVLDAIRTISDDDMNLQFLKSRLLDKEIGLKESSSDTSSKVLLANNDQPSNRTQQRKNLRGRGSFRRPRGHFNARNNHHRQLIYKKNSNGYRRKPFYNQRSNDFCGRTGHFMNSCTFKAQY